MCSVSFVEDWIVICVESICSVWFSGSSPGVTVSMVMPMASWRAGTDTTSLGQTYMYMEGTNMMVIMTSFLKQPVEWNWWRLSLNDLKFGISLPTFWPDALVSHPLSTGEATCLDKKLTNLKSFKENFHRFNWFTTEKDVILAWYFTKQQVVCESY